MKSFMLAMTLSLICAAASATELLSTHSWDADNCKAVGASYLGPSQDKPLASIRVASKGEARKVTVLVIQRPPIQRANYAVRGQVRTKGVEGRAFLEMWSHFEGGDRFFSRTLGAQGPMAALTGDQQWRPFLLPFQNKAEGPAPSRLEVSVVLPGSGQVWLGPLEIVQFELGDDPTQSGQDWFSSSVAGFLGGLIGTLVGLMGAFIGWAATRAKARAAVMFLLGLMGLMGLAGAVLGVLALMDEQTYAVTYTLLLIGGLGLVLPTGLYMVVKKRYQQAELRRMQAMDTP